jgi:16S rRNA (cytosine967-C5)-methyltransferase
VISPARRACYTLLRKIESDRLFSDDALNSEMMQRLDLRDRHLVTEIVYGCLRWQALLDHILAGASSRPWPDVEPGAKTLLRMSLYQMWKMDRIPDHALVNDAVELAKRELAGGIDRFINGILRGLARIRIWQSDLQAPAWAQVSLPSWLWNRWISRYGEKAARDYALSLNVPPRIAGRAVESTEVPGGMAASEWVPGAYIRLATAGDPAENFQRPLQYQDEASQLIPNLLGQDIRGWRIWDACAAPGGKAAILCGKCGDAGRVTASDLREKRLLRMINLINGDDRANLHNLDVLVADARDVPPFTASFDAVLTDVPCSGLGTLRRNPEIKWHFKPEEFAALQANQKLILEATANAVQSGGFLLYSTCSTEPEENEDVVNSFLTMHLDFSLVRPVYPPPIEVLIGQDKMIRTFPGTYLWDGFFAALMIRS